MHYRFFKKWIFYYFKSENISETISNIAALGYAGVTAYCMLKPASMRATVHNNRGDRQERGSE